MFHAHGLSKSCSLLAVFCGEFVDRKEADVTGHASFPFQDLVSSGRLEVQTLVNPPVEKFREVQHLTNPNILYFQGERLVSEEEVGSLVWAGVDVSDPEKLSSLIGPSLPTAVYLEVQNSEKVAEALHSKGIPYVIYWKYGFSSYSASHFRHAFFSIVQSSCSHTWDAFQLAHASFRLYCVRDSNDSPINNRKVSGKLVPCLLGEAPKFSISPKEKDLDDEESSSDALPAISIYDVDVDIAFLVCGVPCTLDARLGSLEDGLNTLLKIEVRGSKLHNRVSATPPPPFQAGGFSPGVVTMRCDITTCSSAHISLLVSGSPQILFDDQLLETHIKNELVEKSQLVHALPSSGGNKVCSVEPRRSSSIACGASVFEVCMKVPIWATQVLKQLAPDVSYRSLVTLGIASIQGSSVSSFEKEDAKGLLFFCTEQETLDTQDCTSLTPDWFRFPAPSRNGPVADQEMKLWSPGMTDEMVQNGIKGRNFPLVPVRQRLKVDAMRPIPHKRHHKMLPFSGTPETDLNYNSYMKPTLPALPSSKHMLPNPVSRRKSLSNSRAQQRISLTPLPLKKHGCDRSPIRACSEEEFLSDVMQFLILRGHSRLIPQGGVSEFPDVILNAKRLDLYNLYREVVSRGGFHVGNGINWKGQVFSKMRNHTLTNRMTGVGNSLKRHYETYLLEYELAHDDVDGECCLLCHSSAPGDWVNCGLCGEWAHFGCDRRQGLGAFKDYAKTDGLEYICPRCSVTNARRKCLKAGNGI